MTATEERFGPGDAARVLGIPPVSFQQWLNRRLIRFRTRREGRRVRRYFLADDLIRLTIVSALYRLGLAPADAKKLVRVIEPVFFDPTESLVGLIVIHRTGREYKTERVFQPLTQNELRAVGTSGALVIDPRGLREEWKALLRETGLLRQD